MCAARAQQFKIQIAIHSSAQRQLEKPHVEHGESIRKIQFVSPIAYLSASNVTHCAPNPLERSERLSENATPPHYRCQLNTEPRAALKGGLRRKRRRRKRARSNCCTKRDQTFSNTENKQRRVGGLF